MPGEIDIVGTGVFTRIGEGPFTLGAPTRDGVGGIGLSTRADGTSRGFVLTVGNGKKHTDDVAAGRLDGVVEIGRFNAPFNGLSVLVVGGFRLYLNGSDRVDSTMRCPFAPRWMKPIAEAARKSAASTDQQNQGEPVAQPKGVRLSLQDCSRFVRR